MQLFILLIVIVTWTVTCLVLNSHLWSLFSLTIYGYFPYNIETKVYATFVAVHVRSKSIKLTL